MNYVNNVRIVDKKTTICKLYFVHVAYMSAGNRNNMAGHLHRHHKEVDITEKVTASLSDRLDCQTARATQSYITIHTCIERQM